MKTELIKVGQTYRIRPGCYQADGESFSDMNVTIVRIAFPPRKRPVYYDAFGNMFRSSDFLYDVRKEVI